MQELFSCVLQPDSHTVACRVPNDGNLIGGRTKRVSCGQAAVFGRGRKCCAGHGTVTLVVLWLSSAMNGVILWARSTFLNDEVCWNTCCVSCCHPYLFLWCFNCVPALLFLCWVPACVVNVSSSTPPSGLAWGVLTLQGWVLGKGNWRLGAFTGCCWGDFLPSVDHLM